MRSTRWLHRARRALVAATILTLLATPRTGRAQLQPRESGPSATPRTAAGNGHTIPVPVATAAPRNGPILIDGKLDDGALYVAARMHDSHGRAGVTTNLVRRDDDFNSDFFQVVIDGYHTT